MIPQNWFREAAERIAPHIQRTPLTFDHRLNIFFKWENRQVTGSFKVRGALNRILSLSEDERRRGIVTASAGNHGQGVALACNLVGVRPTVFASEHAVSAKITAMRSLGAEVQLVQGGYEEAEQAGLQHAATFKKTWISPYNDIQVIAGQGTVGMEILQELHPGDLPAVVVPVGGGGLISGTAAALALARPEISVIGVQAEASPFMHSLFYHGNQDGVQDLPTLADGLSGAVEQGSLTVPMVHRYVDDLLLVSEEEIERAIVYAWLNYHEVIEGSAAVGLAVILKGKVKPPALVVISGGNIQPEAHSTLCGKYPKQP